MCYNLAFLQKRLEKYSERYKHVAPVGRFANPTEKDLPQFYFVSGFTHPSLPLICNKGITFARWGLIPSWIKDADKAMDIRSKTLNAVGETIFERPSFKNAIQSRRCILGVNGFFEWRDINKVKYPYYIQPKSKELFSLGCIYDTWIDQTTGEMMDTFSIITTPANPLMERIHNIKKRMPLIIPVENESEWVNPQLSTQQIKALIKPYNETYMTAYTISQKANNAKIERNSPDILERVQYTEITGV